MTLKEKNTTRREEETFLTRNLRRSRSSLSRSVVFFSIGGGCVSLSCVTPYVSLGHAPCGQVTFEK